MVAFVAVAGLGSLAMTACSSSPGSTAAGGGSTASPGASSTAASGTPIKIGMSVPVKAVIDFSAAVSAAKGAVRAVNAAGGVDGHPLDLIVCNNQFNPNQERDCARTLISDGVVATVGDIDYSAEKDANELYQAAGVAQIGDTPSGFSETDPNSYLFWGGQSYVNAAEIYAAAKWGSGHKVATLDLAVPFDNPFPAFWRKACAVEGCQVVAQTTVQTNQTTDLSPYAQQLVSGQPDTIAVDLGPLLQELVPALDQLGYTGKVADQDTNLTPPNFLSQPAGIQDQYINISPFPPPFASGQFLGIKQFLTEMQAEAATGDSTAPTYTNDSDMSTMAAWLAVHVFAEIAGPAHAFTAASFKKAIDAAQNVSLLGLSPNWTPDEANAAVPSLPRVSLDAWYFYTYVNGKPKLLNSRPVALTSLVAKVLG
jgi:branched-chain amino acid transport system substrate-binding protein